MHEITLVLKAKPQRLDDPIETAKKAKRVIERLVGVSGVRVLAAKEVAEDA